MFWSIDIKDGKVEFDQISELPDSFAVKNCVEILREDMLQITFPNGILIDVGWRPCFSSRGKFYIVAVSNENWDEPVATVKASNVIQAKEALQKMINELTQ